MSEPKTPLSTLIEKYVQEKITEAQFRKELEMFLQKKIKEVKK